MNIPDRELTSLRSAIDAPTFPIGNASNQYSVMQMFLGSSTADDEERTPA